MTGTNHQLSECDDLFDAEKYEDALKCYDAVLAVDLDNADALQNKAAALLNLGRHEEALKCCDMALAVDPDNTGILQNKADALLNLDRYQEALECYDAVLAIDLDNTDALHNRADALFNLDRYQEALNCYDTLLAGNHGDVDALQNKAAALLNLGRHEEALKCCDMALAVDPDNTGILQNKADALLNLDRYQDALNYYDTLLAGNPGDVDALQNKATALYLMKRYQEAITYYDGVLKSHPDDANTLFYKGRALDGLGHHKQASICIDKARDLDDTFALKKLELEFILNTKYRVLYNEAEILEARNALFESLTSHTTKTGYASLGFQGGQEPNRLLAYGGVANIWWDTNREDKHGCEPNSNRYWNCFGIGEPQWKKSNNIIVELNFPKSGIDRRIAGAMVKDRQNHLYLAHSGKINTSKGGAELNWSDHHSILVDDGRKQPRGMILVSVVTGSDVLDNVAEFVHRVAKSKAESKARGI